jgi:hypothetical protein
MKKMIKVVGVLLFSAVVFLTLTAESCEVQESSATKNARANEAVAQQAITAVEVPVPEHFLERKAVAAWFKTWDNPAAISYLYIFTQQGCIGYFVTDGKPISNRSYLTPEEAYYANGAVLQTPSLDGTYGSDLEGIRFKNAKGVWHEFGGTNFSYIYATAPIPGLSMIKLGD